MFGYPYQPNYFVPGQPAPDQLQQLRMAQQPMMPQPQQPAQQQPQSGLIWVQGEAGAKSYLVAAGMDSESQTFYLKSADASGMPSMRIFDYHEREAQKPQPMQAQDNKNYVTREEFNALAARLDAMTAKPVKKQKEVTADEPTV